MTLVAMLKNFLVPYTGESQKTGMDLFLLGEKNAIKSTFRLFKCDTIYLCIQ